MVNGGLGRIKASLLYCAILTLHCFEFRFKVTQNKRRILTTEKLRDSYDLLKIEFIKSS